MLLRLVPVASVLFIVACSSTTTRNVSTQKTSAPVIKYAQNNSKIVPTNAIASSNNLCVDHFNFLRQAGDDKYQKFSRDYVQIGDGYRFLSTNKNIMNGDAKRVYTNTLDIKLTTLCSEVNYAGFQVIQQKINALSGI